MTALAENDILGVHGQHVGNLFALFPEDFIKETTPSEFLDDRRNQIRKQLLITPNMVAVLDQLRFWKDSTNSAKRGVLLTGVGGVGKSTLLYLAVGAARRLGFSVVYIPTAPNNPLSLYNAMRLNEDLFGKDNLDNLLPKYRVSIGEFGIDLINLLNDPSLPSRSIVVAIDQWNSMATLDCTYPPYSKQLSNFSDLIARFCVIGAVSSTFVNVRGITTDADLFTFSYVINVFTREQLSVLVQNSTFKSELSVMDIYDATGGVPRMIEYLYRCLQDNDNSKSAFLNYMVLAKAYYKARVNKVLVTDKSNAVAAVAAMIVRNKNIRTIPDIWTQSGVLVNNGGIATPVCDACRLAVIDAVADDRSRLVQLLASDANSRPWALEMMMTLYLSPGIYGDSGFTFKNLDLAGNIRKDPESFTLGISRVILQPKNDPWNVELDLGTVVICRDGFPVIDYFVLSNDGEYFFIQVSLSSYTKHPAKADSLYSDNSRLGGGTVLAYWLQKAGKRNSRRTRTPPENWHYVYVCPLVGTAAYASKLATQSKHKDTILITGTELKDLGGDWHCIVDALSN